MHPSTQRLIPSPPVPAMNSSHCYRYRYQSTFNECVSPMNPEHRSWCVFRYIVVGMRFEEKQLLTDSFPPLDQHQLQLYSKMRLYFAFSFTSPLESRNICFHVPGIPPGVREAPVIPIPMKLAKTYKYARTRVRADNRSVGHGSNGSINLGHLDQ